MRRLAIPLTVLAVALTACGTPDQAGDVADDITLGETAEAGDQSLEEQGAAAGSCLAGDADCTDESNGGGDVAREVPVGDQLPTAEEARRGEADGATGRMIEAVVPQSDTTLGIAFSGGACDVVQDVMVMEDESEVRIMVLAGREMGVDACTDQLVTWTTTVTLEAPLGERTVLDISG